MIPKTLRILTTALVLVAIIGLAPAGSLSAEASAADIELSSGTQHRATVDPDGRV